MTIYCFVFFGALHVSLIGFNLDYMGTNVSVGVWGLIGKWIKPCHRRKTLLVVGGTQTQVLADSMDNTTSCAT